jgi:hypothetical protein
LQRKIANELDLSDPSGLFIAACQEMVKEVAKLIGSSSNIFGKPWIESSLVNLLYALCVGYTAYEREIPDNTAALWGDNTEPNDLMIMAKMVRYSSNLYACAGAYPSTCLDSNLDYDMRQLLTFMHVYAKRNDIDLMKLVEEEILNS